MIQIGFITAKPKNQSAKKILRNIGVFDLDAHDTKPDFCYNCESSDIIPLEIVDLSPEALFWVCQECDCKSLHSPLDYVIELIDNSRDIYINPRNFDDLFQKVEA